MSPSLALLHMTTDRTRTTVASTTLSDSSELTTTFPLTKTVETITTATQTNKKKTVSFDSTVRMRIHTMTIGDNPSVSTGTPISLDWPIVVPKNGTHQSTSSVSSSLSSSVSQNEHYESLDHQVKHQEARYAAAIKARYGRRVKRERHVPHGPPVYRFNYYDRIALLEKSGYDHAAIQQGQQAIRPIQSQRQRTLRSQVVTLTGHSLRRELQSIWHPRQKQNAIQHWYDVYGPIIPSNHNHNHDNHKNNTSCKKT